MKSLDKIQNLDENQDIDQKRRLYGKIVRDLAKENGLPFSVCTSLVYEMGTDDYSHHLHCHIAFQKKYSLLRIARFFDNLFEIDKYPGFKSELGNVAELTFKTLDVSVENQGKYDTEAGINIISDKAYNSFKKATDILNSKKLPYFPEIFVYETKKD